MNPPTPYSKKNSLKNGLFLFSKASDFLYFCMLEKVALQNNL